MRPTFTKSGTYQGLAVYMPVIVHDDGRREVLPGDPLANGITATKYAALEVNARRKAGAK